MSYLLAIIYCSGFSIPGCYLLSRGLKTNWIEITDLVLDKDNKPCSTELWSWTAKQGFTISVVKTFRAEQKEN